jgi:hypothetical protein
MTTVTAQPPAGSSFPDDAFATITAVPVVGMAWVSDGLAVTFDGVLTATEAEQVRKRIGARDAADWAVREALLAQVEAASTLAETTAALIALTHYLFDKES